MNNAGRVTRASTRCASKTRWAVIRTVIPASMRTPLELERFPDLDPHKLQDMRHVARAVRFALTQPRESIVAEIIVLPMQETSWP
jgi:hypothetical protein